MTTTTAIATVSLDAEELRALPASRAEQIRAVFLPMAARVEAFEDAYNKIMVEAAEAVTPEVSQRARRLRLDIARVRIDAENARKSAKEEYLRASQAIDGVNGVLKWAIVEKEKALESIEKHAERMEEERRAALHAERADALLRYVDEIPNLDFSAMDDEVWAAYLSTKQRDHATLLEAERAAEEKRIAEAEANARSIARSHRVAPVFDFFPGDLDLGTLPDDEFDALLSTATEAKAAHEAEQERVRAEAARLAKEAEKKEKARLAELAKIEAARRKEREAAEAEREKARLATEAERTRREALEAAEAARLAKEKDEREARARAEANAAKAPVRKRLAAWVQTFALPDLPGDDHAKAAEIRAKFEAFRAWAEKEVAAI